MNVSPETRTAIEQDAAAYADSLVVTSCADVDQYPAAAHQLAALAMHYTPNGRYSSDLGVLAAAALFEQAAKVLRAGLPGDEQDS